MENRLKNVKITGLFGEKNIDWSLRPDVNVLVGKNGVGKSIILQLIDRALRQEAEETLKLCQSVIVDFSDGVKNIAFRKENPEQNEIKEAYFEAMMRDDERLTTLTEIERQNIIDELLEKAKNIDFPELNHAYAFNTDGKILEPEFISTVQASANASNVVSKSNGRKYIVLNSEIQDEVKKLKERNLANLEDRLKSSLNMLLTETGKSLLTIDSPLSLVLENGKSLPYQQLSAGERQLIYIFLKVANATQNNALILMDEPEISLHLSWQEKLINEIRKVNPTSQLIIVTHSPAIVMNGWIDCLVDFKDIVSDSHGEPARLSDKS